MCGNTVPANTVPPVSVVSPLKGHYSPLYCHVKFGPPAKTVRALKNVNTLPSRSPRPRPRAKHSPSPSPKPRPIRSPSHTVADPGLTVGGG